MEYTLAGSYRRGEQAVYDVVVLLSHTDTAQTEPGFVGELVALLKKLGCVKHTLHLGHELATHDQEDPASDELEKARIVWHEAKYSESPYRRVDIVVVPPRSVGSALLRWTGAATFVRDLGLWCEKKGWTFSSEGVFEPGGRRPYLVDGTWEKGKTMQDAEKRLLEGLGLPWVCPEERCTG